MAPWAASVRSASSNGSSVPKPLAKRITPMRLPRRASAARPAA
jgi:hypothetical protein